MRIFSLLPTLLVAAIVMTACGSPAPTQTATATATAPVPTATASTAATSPTLVAGATTVGGQPTQVNVTLADNTIESSLTTFQAGVPYTFVVTNHGRHAHNFVINTPVDKAGSLDAALQSALLAVDQSELSVGAIATLDFTFPASAAGADLEFSCLIPRHYEDGMRLPISVMQ